MAGELRIGAILHYRNFAFEDGTKRNKYMIVLGANPGRDYLLALTTSQRGRKKAESGCHHRPSTYFFIPGDGKNFFPKDTWIVLSNPIIMDGRKVILKGIQNTLQIESNLKENIIGEIRNCLKASRDISGKQMQLL